MLQWEKVPDGGKKEGGGDGDESEEKDHHYRVFLVHEMAAQVGSAAGNAAICELDVEGAERRGNVEDEQAVAEADGRVSARI